MRQIVYHGKNNPATASTLNSLGVNYRDQGNLDKANYYIKQAYDMIMECEGYDDRKSRYKRNLDEIEEKILKKIGPHRFHP